MFTRRAYDSVILFGVKQTMTNTRALFLVNAGPSARRPLRPAAPTLTVTLSPLARAARDTLASYLDVPPDAIAVSAVESTTFTSTALGFPERDGMYASCLAEGTIVRFTHDGRRYEFHGVGDQASDGLYGEVPASGPPTWWRRDPRGIFVPDRAAGAGRQEAPDRPRYS